MALPRLTEKQVKEAAEQRGVEAGEMLHEFAKNNPEIARDLEDFGNVAAIIFGPKGKPKTSGASFSYQVKRSKIRTALIKKLSSSL